MYFVLSQTRDVWSNHVGLFDLSEKCLCYYEMKVQKIWPGNGYGGAGEVRRRLCPDILSRTAGRKAGG